MADSPANEASSNTPSTSTSAVNTTSPSDSGRKPATPLRCLVGAIVAGGLSYLLWQLTNAIAISFAKTPIHSDNMIVLRVSTAIRTLVVGMSTMGTGIFGLASVGLIGLGIQLLSKKSSETPSET